MSVSNRLPLKALLALTLTAVLVAGGGAAANAVESESDAIGALVNVGLLDGVRSQQSERFLAYAPSDAPIEDNGPVEDNGPTGQLAPGSGLTVGSNGSSVQISPVTEGPGEIVAGGAALQYADTSSYSYVMTGQGAAANAGYAVIHDASAPTQYQFQVDANGAPASLTSLADGSVQVSDASGKQVNVILPAWARDANGASVPSDYSVEGNIVTQTVQHSGAAYPVVADPRLQCDGLWCTLELNRAETAAMADNALNAGIVCGVTGPIAPACAILVMGGWAAANAARATGQCIGIRWWARTPGAHLHLASIGCYA